MRSTSLKKAPSITALQVGFRAKGNRKKETPSLPIESYAKTVFGGGSPNPCSLRSPAVSYQSLPGTFCLMEGARSDLPSAIAVLFRLCIKTQFKSYSNSKSFVHSELERKVK